MPRGCKMKLTLSSLSTHIAVIWAELQIDCV
jgi:hypothetical protein